MRNISFTTHSSLFSQYGSTFKDLKYLTPSRERILLSLPIIKVLWTCFHCYRPHRSQQRSWRKKSCCLRLFLVCRLGSLGWCLLTEDTPRVQGMSWIRLLRRSLRERYYIEEHMCIHMSCRCWAMKCTSSASRCSGSCGAEWVWVYLFLFQRGHPPFFSV